VQSGSDAILEAMNRKHTALDYRRVIDALRQTRPDLALSSDFIVGFPGETETEFEATLEIVERVGFAQAYSFKYSPRPGTPAALMSAQVAEEVKIDRLHRLHRLLDRHQTAFNLRCVGSTLPVLFDRRGRKAGQLAGRSPYLQSVHAEADSSVLGNIVPVEIRSAGPNSLAGVIVQDTGHSSAA
jgi:tRNA-2-methylthio-N6-dimethylallyladenosine synthase